MAFTEHGITTMNPEEGTCSGGKSVGVPICSEEQRKLTWMRDTRIRLFMQMELMACRDESNWLIRFYHCAVNNYSEENCSPMPPPVPLDYNEKTCKRGQKAVKGIVRPILKIILKTHYTLPVKQHSLIPPSSLFTIPVTAAEC